MKKSLGTMVAIMVVAILIGTFIAAKSSTAGEKARDGRFIAYDNGTVLDTKTNLMWAAKDNGGDIKWQDAKFYCENYRGGGYKDWRMPKLDELEGLYDESKSRPATCYGKNSIHVVTELIDITCFYSWASETSQTTAESAIFDFGPGIRSGFASQLTRFSRALPVRSGK
jgi:hypothetical protein